MKYILIVINEKGQEIFYGPFENSNQALDWGEKNFNADYTLAAVPLHNYCDFKNAADELPVN